MEKTLVKVSLILTIVILVGLICQCESQERYEQVFKIVETNEVSGNKLNKKLFGTETKQPEEVAGLLARAMDKSSIAEVGSYMITLRELLDLNKYDSTNGSDCTMTEIKKRQTICDQLNESSNFQNYCKVCLTKLIDFCRKFPYKFLLKTSFSKFDWRSHGDILQYSQNFSTYIISDGDEELPLANNTASFLATKEANYKKELKEHCKQFENDVESKLYHLGSSSEESFESLEEVSDDIYTIWRRCKAIEAVKEPEPETEPQQQPKVEYRNSRFNRPEYCIGGYNRVLNIEC